MKTSHERKRNEQNIEAVDFLLHQMWSVQHAPFIPHVGGLLLFPFGECELSNLRALVYTSLLTHR